MESSVPKDVPMTTIEKAQVFHIHSDIAIFNAFDMDMEQNRQKEEFREVIEITVTLKGKLVGFEIPHKCMQNNEMVGFDIKIKRMDVVECLKYGQFITIKGVGYISKISGDFKNVDYDIMTINVSGNLDIR